MIRFTKAVKPKQRAAELLGYTTSNTTTKKKKWNDVKLVKRTHENRYASRARTAEKAPDKHPPFGVFRAASSPVWVRGRRA